LQYNSGGVLAPPVKNQKKNSTCFPRVCATTSFSSSLVIILYLMDGIQNEIILFHNKKEILLLQYNQSTFILMNTGRKMYALTWALQYINLFMINTGFIILAGQALKV
jgi:hypothetical protein